MRPTSRAFPLLVLGGLAAPVHALDEAPAIFDAAEVARLVEQVPDPPLTFSNWSGALAYVRAHATDLHVAQEAVEAERAQSRAALGSALPQMALTGVARRDLLTERVCDPRSANCIDDRTAFSGGVLLIQPVLAPAAWAEARTSRDRVQVRQYLASDQERTARLRLVEAVLAVMTQDRLGQMYREAVRAASERVDLVRKARQMGSMTNVDVVRAAQDLAVALRTVVDTNDKLQQARESLGAVVGSNEPAGINPAFDLAAAASDCRQGEPEQRDDVTAARLQLDVSRADINQVKLRYLPSLNFVSSLTFSTIPFVADRNSSWLVGGDLIIPVWDGGITGAQLRVRQATAKQSAERLELARRTSSLESTHAARRVRSARTSLQVAQSSYRLAADTERLARAALALGGGTVLELLDAARRLRDAAATQVVAEMEMVATEIRNKLTSAHCGGGGS